MARALAGTIGAIAGSAAVLVAACDRVMERSRDAVPQLPHDDADVRQRVVHRRSCGAIPGHDVVVYEHRVRPRVALQSADAQQQRAAQIAASEGMLSGLGRALWWRYASRGEVQPEEEVYRSLVLQPRPRSASSQTDTGDSGSLEDAQAIAGAFSSAANTILSASTDQTMVKCRSSSGKAGTPAAPECDADPTFLCPVYLRTMLTSVATGLRGQRGESVPSVAVIGGAGGALQNYLAAQVPDCVLDVVDIEPEMFEATAYDLGIKASPSTTYFVQDAAEFVAAPDRQGCYDAVLVDVYVGNSVPDRVASEAFIRNVAGMLRRDGGATGSVAFNMPNADSAFEDRCKAVFAEVRASRVPHSGNMVYTCTVAPGAVGATLAAASPFSYSLRAHCP